MKLIFVSDIHGVPAALEKFFAAASRLPHDRIVLLGDALYHGPRNGFHEPPKCHEYSSKWLYHTAL